MTEKKIESISNLENLEFIFGVKGEEEVKNAILCKIGDAHKLMDELNISEITDVFKTDFDWANILNIILEGLCLENDFIRGTERDYSLVCANDKFVFEGGADPEFGIGNCSHLDCPNREEDEDGFICNKHCRWLSPSLPNGDWFSGHGLYVGGHDPKIIKFILGGD